MRRTRAKYHYAVRRVKRDRKNITRQRFVDAVLSDNSRDFWLEVKRMNGNKVGCANVVDDKTNVTSISDHFASYYKVLYNSVPYNHDEMEKIADIVRERTCMAGMTVLQACLQTILS